MVQEEHINRLKSALDEAKTDIMDLEDLVDGHAARILYLEENLRSFESTIATLNLLTPNE